MLRTDGRAGTHRNTLTHGQQGTLAKQTIGLEATVGSARLVVGGSEGCREGSEGGATARGGQGRGAGLVVGSAVASRLGFGSLLGLTFMTWVSGPAANPPW